MRRILIKNLRNSISIKNKPNRIAIRFSSGSALSEDRELQESYTFIPRVAALKELYLNERERTKYFQLINTHNGKPSIFTGLKGFSDLQNPLLLKYKFNPDDFLTGAKEAFCQVHKAMASQDFSNFKNGYSKTSDSDELLKVALSPTMYKACGEASKKIDSEGLSLIMTGVEVDSALIGTF